ncbi:MAG: aspartate kinase [Sulfolobales archaeon]|nr:aspartate kinase [Sulfolobales archaeon]MCG2908047.1 aspartate kinase [Sulfolobales archaeon]
MIIIKIGGSIQKDPNDYHLIAEKIKKFTDDKVIVVASALKNVTNELLQVTNEPEKAVSKVSEIIDRHYDMLSKVSNGKVFEEGFQLLSKVTDELAKVAWAIGMLGENNPRLRDYVLSFGERMAVIILGEALRSYGIDARPITEPPLITDSNYGEANVLLPETKDRLHALLESVKSKVVVVPGFIGTTPEGKYTTIGRGGSDYSATVIAKALNVKEVRLVTEVPGIMTGDPRKFKGAKTIPRLSLEEAVELSQLGAKRLHPKTFDPVFDTDIEVYVEGLYDEGFTVVKGSCTPSDVLKGIAVVEGLTLIDVESTRMVGRIGSAAAVMTEAQKANVNIIAMSQPASETSIQLVVSSSDAKKLQERLASLKEFVKDISAIDVDAVSIVGCGLQRPEIASKVISSAAAYNPISVSRGMRRVSLTFIAERGQAVELAEELHEVVLKWIN